MWEKARHRLIFGAMRIFYRPYLWFKTGYRTGIHRLKKKQGQLIVCNHQSVYDAYMINMAFDRPVFIMAGDYLFNRGKASDRMNWFFAPIPKVKEKRSRVASDDAARAARGKRRRHLPGGESHL